MNIVKFQRRIDRKATTQPTSPGRGSEATPAFTWDQLERQLTDLAGAPERASLAGPLVSALRKQARGQPSEMVLREILCLAWTLMDEAFQPGTGPGEEGEMA